MKKFRFLATIITLAVIAVFAVGCGVSPNGGWDANDTGGITSKLDSDGNEYLEIIENPFIKASEQSASMFALSVSTAAYSNLRRYVNNNNRINPSQINIEQIVNYFRYDYPEPQEDKPLSLTPSLFPCPWNSNAQLLTVGVKAKSIPLTDVRNNLVFLLDVSGSMYSMDRLPLVQQAFLLLLENLDENDTISIVTYAGSDKVLLDGGNGSEKTKISAIIEDLSASGSTAGGRGIQRAYELAAKHFIPGGNNRVILATDGDFNVGISSPSELEQFISRKRDTGVYLTALGFGFGNLKSTTLETLANKGNGSYAYIDTIHEARKVLVEEIGSTLNVVAKDAKACVEFNPDYIHSYRLLGYENLLLTQEQWEDFTTDAGEIGSGFTVTAVYEVIFNEGADLNAAEASYLDAAIRYKSPDTADTTQYEIKATCGASNICTAPTRDMQFISALVETSLLLRSSRYKGEANMASVTARLAALDLSDNPYMQEFRTLATKIQQQYFSAQS